MREGVGRGGGDVCFLEATLKVWASVSAVVCLYKAHYLAPLAKTLLVLPL